MEVPVCPITRRARLNAFVKRVSWENIARKVNAKWCHYVFQLKKPLRSVAPGPIAGERSMVHVLTVHWFVVKFSISGLCVVSRL